MGLISFAIDWYALAIVALFCALSYLLYGLKQRYLPPLVFVSELTAFKTGKGWRVRCAALQPYLQYLGLGALLLAFINPRMYTETTPPTDPRQLPSNQATQGIALYLVLDQSGSMNEPISVQDPSGLPKRTTKINLLKELTMQFVKGDPQLGLTGRPNDLIGMVEFARTSRLAVPLTLDHQQIINKLAEFQVVQDKADDGTAIGYAIFKTSNLIASTRNFARDLVGRGKPAYEIKNAVIILVTDGMQDPNPADIGSRWRWIDPLEAAQFAKNNNIRLYIINLEPAFNAEKYSANRSQMRKTAEITGGKFFMLNDGTSLAGIYAEIDKLEKSDLPVEEELLKSLRRNLSRDQLPNLYNRLSLYPYFIALGLLCLGLWVLMETLLLRRLP